MPSDPLLASLSVWLAVHLLAGSMWSTLRLGRRARAAVLLPVGLACFFAPLLLARDPLGPFMLCGITCPVMVLKLRDLHVGAAWWREQRARLWWAYLPLPFVLVVRRHLREPQRPRHHSLRLLTRGLLEMALGYWMLDRAHAWDIGATSFWLDQVVKILALYALMFDGGLVVVTALLRLTGIHVMDLSRHPIVARTPADFWRRYNRVGGRFLYENVFVPSGGVNAPVRGTLLVFAVNGILHEGLAFLFIGEVLGYQLLYFAIHALAVALTFRLRLRRRHAWIGIACTFSLVMLTSAIFFASVEAISPGSFYAHGTLFD